MASEKHGGNGKGIAPPNQPYTRRPDDPARRAWWLLLRLAGQARRQYLCRVKPDYVARMRAERLGECRQCGACCHLTFRCPFLTNELRCDRYERRTVTCRDFPVDAMDLKLTRVPCGHFYKSRLEEKTCADSSG